MIYAKDINEHTPWQELTPGGEIYEPGTARLFNTGTWRTNTPVFHEEACKHCMLCVPFCPDSAIPVKTGNVWTSIMCTARVAVSVKTYVPSPRLLWCLEVQPNEPPPFR